METKQCPYCGEEILLAAKKCKHCGEWLEEKPAAKPAAQAAEPRPASKPEPAPEAELVPSPVAETSSDEKPGESPSFFEYYLERVWSNGTMESGIGAVIPGLNFDGKLSCKRFWLSLLFVWLTFGIIANLVIRIPPSIFTKFTFSGLTSTLIYLFFVVKVFEMQVRRLNDIGKSGWLSLLALIPLVNIASIVLYCQKGSDDTVKTVWRPKDWGWIAAMVILSIAALSWGRVERMIHGGNPTHKELRISANNSYYKVYGYSWTPDCTGRTFYTIASTEKEDMNQRYEEFDYGNRVEIYYVEGIPTIVSATSVDGAMTPVITAEDIVENDVDINDWHSLYFDLLPSSVDSNLLYFNYCIVGQGGPISCGAVDCSTGEFALYNGAILGTIQKGTYIHSLLVEDDRARKLYIMDPFEPGEQATYQEELDFSYLQNNTAEEIIAWIGRQ